MNQTKGPYRDSRTSVSYRNDHVRVMSRWTVRRDYADPIILHVRIISLPQLDLVGECLCVGSSGKRHADEYDARELHCELGLCHLLVNSEGHLLFPVYRSLPICQLMIFHSVLMQRTIIPFPFPLHCDLRVGTKAGEYRDDWQAHCACHVDVP